MDNLFSYRRLRRREPELLPSLKRAAIRRRRLELMTSSLWLVAVVLAGVGVGTLILSLLLRDWQMI